ncbi:MAG: dihydrolipoyl dehydrogenase [bacterium]
MYDLIVIGSGPGGYIASVRAGQLGMKVACIEKYETYGGTCLNVGCIPSKALLESSDKYEEARHALAQHGVNVGDVGLDLSKMMERKYGVVKQLTDGIKFLFKKYKVDGINGFGSIVDKTHVKVTAADGTEQVLETKRILIATGSKPSAIPGVVVDKDRIVDSTGALSFPEIPKHLIVIGAGVIGLELGSVWRRLGSKVTVLEYMPKILGNSDAEIAKEAKKIFAKQGIEFVLDVKVTGATVKGETATVSYEDKSGAAHTIEADRVLLAVGRKPYTTNLGLENVGVETDKRGVIQVDKNFETNVKGIYAIGDVIPGAMLAHKAEEEGVVCVERMNGIGAHINYDAIPDVVYTEPEIAGVGKTEEQLKEAGIPYKKGKFTFVANGRAKALAHTEGFVKILAHEKTDRILGAQIIGPRAGDLIAELAVAMEFGASAEDIGRSSHAHPTLAEVVKEAALSVNGPPLNS